MKKLYLSADQLLEDAFSLGHEVHNSGYHPDIVVGIWRGGAPIAIAMHEFLLYQGIDCDHTVIRTRHYTGINQTADAVSVDGLEYLLSQLPDKKRLLLVDDIFDSGKSVARVLKELEHNANSDFQVRIATPYFKPAKNQTDIKPDYFLHETDDWLVFPHELCGLSKAEIVTHKPLSTSLKASVFSGDKNQ